MTLYQTPIGTFDTWEQAAAALERSDFDPCESGMIKPIVIERTEVHYEQGPGGKLRFSRGVTVY